MRPDTPQHLSYRPEIDGLRTLAVLPVVLFHAGFNAFSGGFVGVDVFFVISGYLITSILVNDLRGGRFSIRSFYERRARRILPALFFVIAACVPAAYFWMLPPEALQFSRSVLATLAFVPNVYFWLTTSYFGTAAQDLPLLHTWSLGVEEQFYVVFPLMVWLCWRKGVGVVVLLVFLLAAASFGLSEWAWRAGRIESNFFLAPTRAWELMAGALLSLESRRGPIHDRLGRVTSDAGALAGLAMLAYAVFGFERTTPTPGSYALWPVVGCALIIACAGPKTLVHRLLASKPMVGIGLISYSAYLWHQPLFAFARLRNSYEEPTAIVRIGLVLAALVLAFLTWRFVERPFRRGLTISRRTMLVSLATAWSALLGLGLLTDATQGFVSRMSPVDAALAAMADSAAQGRYVAARFISLESDFPLAQLPGRRVLVVGDSYAEDFVNVMAAGGALSDYTVRTVHLVVECQPYFGARDVSAFIEPPAYRRICRDARARAGEQLRRRAAMADVIVFAASWQRWAAELLPETLAEFGSTPSRRVFVVGPKRTGEINIRRLLEVPESERSAISQPRWPAVDDMEQLLRREVPESVYVSMQSAICGDGPRCNLFTPSGQLISFDGRHLTAAGAELAGRHLFTTKPLSDLVSRSSS